VDLNTPAGRDRVGGGVWRRALGLIPGEPNQGLVAEIEASPARLADYDDSAWEVTDNVRDLVSKGFTFGWWRITVEIPQELDGMSLDGAAAYIETNVDNYGEVWIDGDIDLVSGVVVGFNAQQRAPIPNATPGSKHVIAILAANGPFALPRGVIFLRYVTLAFETRG
jgi:hypothetical protein